MTIPERMDAPGVLRTADDSPEVTGESPRPPSSPRSAPWRPAANVGAQVGLGTAGLIHAAWAAGSTWPTSSSDDLADLVVGARPFPSGPMTLGVVALIGVGAGLVGSESRRLQAEGRRRTADRLTRSQHLVRVGAWGVAGVLALRGAGGMVVSALGLGRATELFRYWDLRLYSPLCLVLAVLIVLAVRSNMAAQNRAGASGEAQ